MEKALVVFHPSPGSYTGEDVAEISCHGNPLLVDTLLKIIGQTGLARPAERGEFTRRAFINGKMDLAQAEAVGALINAGSTAGMEMARNLLNGELSCRLKRISDDLHGIISDIEASFIIEDVDTEFSAHTEKIKTIIHEMDAFLMGSENASGLYSGIVTTIAGLPNAGKSSLFNALLGYERAIVHHESGTTRDVIREHVVLYGMDFMFHDTAGIRDTSSGPEEIGVRKTMEILAQSDLVLYVVDASRGLQPHEEKWLDLGKKTILVMNKADLLKEKDLHPCRSGTVWVSAKYHEGMSDLTASMNSLFPRDLPGIFIERHTYLLRRARECLLNCLESARSQITPDALVIDMKAAAELMAEVTGEIYSKDILDSIFSRFCVGK